MNNRFATSLYTILNGKYPTHTFRLGDLISPDNFAPMVGIGIDGKWKCTIPIPSNLNENDTSPHGPFTRKCIEAVDAVLAPDVQLVIGEYR
jgi:hypothetical protein